MLLGVNEWDSPENVPPGQVQGAVNVDFTSGDGVTRGGFVCLPSLGTTTAWTSRTSAADNSWNAVTYGNGLYVAVAGSGVGNRVMTSPDGITWTSRTSAADNVWTGVAYGAGLYVAVSSDGTGNQVMTSPDGITWTSRVESGTAAWQDVVFGNGLFVAVSSSASPKAMTSSDGITWTSRTVPTATGFRGVTYGEGRFLAVAPGTNFAYSADGVTWTSLSVTSISGFWRSVTYGNGRFVAVGVFLGGIVAASSDDGFIWTSRTAPSLDWEDVDFGNGLFVAVSSSGTGSRAMTSSDGITWTASTTPADNSWQSVVTGAAEYVAVGSSGTGNRVMTSGFQGVWASAIYSDPEDIGSQWIAVAGGRDVRFHAFGRTSRTVSYATGLTVTEQSTMVQANNQLFIFRGPDETPLRWDGNWANNFELATGSIPNSNQALYYQNRLWAIVGKDGYYASDVLDFTAFTEITNQFNLSTGDSNFLVTSYPFGNSTILLFKNQSIMALSNVEGSLGDVVASEITRQVGAVGINAVVSVGPDVVYMSNRNINLITLTTTNNSLQHKTLPLSRNIQKIFNRVNWEYGYKVSMGFYDNKLFVALPLDNSTTCNAVVVYNFVTENWFGEWNFDSALGIAIQNFVVANYLGLQRLHAVSEDGRIFVVGEGPLDVSGSTFSEISSSVTTRAYSMGNQDHIPRRMYIDIATWRPEFSVTAYSNGVSEYSEEVTDQTFSRSESWIFNDSAYALANTGDDYNRAFRKDYAGYPSESIQCQSGFLPEAEQEIRFPIITRRKGRLSWLKVENAQGLLRLMTVGFEARAGDRSNFIQAT